MLKKVAKDEQSSLFISGDKEKKYNVFGKHFLCLITGQIAWVFVTDKLFLPCLTFAWLSNVLRGLTGMSTLAYLSIASVMKKKCYLNFTNSFLFFISSLLDN